MIKNKKRPKEHHYTAAFHYTSPNFTSLHLLTLHSLSFTLHYPLIWLNPFKFPTADETCHA